MKLVIYVRVSSVEQVSGYSLDAQEAACRQWAADNGHEIVRIFVEPGQSARTDKRPAFQTMIQLVKAGAAEAILIHKSDRIARNLLDLLSYRSQLEQAGRRILSVTEPFLNDDSPESRMVVGIIGSVNEFYSANLSREVQKGQAQKARSGSFPGGKLPRGYTRDDNKKIVLSDEAELISRTFVEFSMGRVTLREWTDRHGHHPQTWGKILRNIFYTGRFVWKGETYQGDHPPLVEDLIFEQVQEIMDSRDSGGAKQRHFWLLADLLWSAVHQRKMVGSLVGQRYGYYRAVSPGGPEHSVSAQSLEERVIKLLEMIRGVNNRAREAWRLAMSVAPSMGAIWRLLASDPDRREFLRLIFAPCGIVVEAGGAISSYRLHPGFVSC